MTERLRTKIFPAAVGAQAFGTDVKKLVNFEPSTHTTADSYSTDIIFGRVTLEQDNGQLVTESVVCKIQPEMNLTSPKPYMDSHFYNEVLFYTQVLPFLRKYDTDGFLSKSVPEFIYGKATRGQDPGEDAVVLKNVSEKNFQMSAEKLFLDDAHIKLVLDRLAKYHALSFKSVRDDPDGFRGVSSKIQTFDVQNSRRNNSEFSWDLLRLRGVDPLKNDPKYKDRLADVYEHCKNGTAWVDACQCDATGPLSVLVHGDLTRNNVMFKYGSDGQPEEVMFVDWGIIRHSSLVNDLAVFLTLHASPEMKQLHWDDFLRTYHNALSQQLGKLPGKPSLEDLEHEVREKGVYGYHWSLFLVPASIQTVSKEQLRSQDPASVIKFMLEFGGERATKILTNIVKHMIDRNYVFQH